MVYHLGGGTLNVENPHKTFLNFRNNLLMIYKNELPEKVRKKKKSAVVNYNNEKVFLASTQPREIAYGYFETSRYRLTDDEVEERVKRYGENEIAKEKKNQGLALFIKTFMNPFIGILMALALVSFIVDVLLEEPNDRDWTTVLVISTMVFLSSVLRFGRVINNLN
jgi:Mg2+-importing ATPase